MVGKEGEEKGCERETAEEQRREKVSGLLENAERTEVSGSRSSE